MSLHTKPSGHHGREAGSTLGTSGYDMTIAQEHIAAVTSFVVVGVGIELVSCGVVLSFLVSWAGKTEVRHCEVKGKL